MAGATGSWGDPPATATPPTPATWDWTPPPTPSRPPPTPDNWNWSPPQAVPLQPQKPPLPPVNRALLPATDTVSPPPPVQGLARWRLMPPAQQQSIQFGPASNIVSQVESGNKNVRQIVDGQPVGPASGFLQIEDPTWREFAPQVGVNPDRYPDAMSAPPQVQLAVASRIPLYRWAPGTVRNVVRAFPWANPNMTLGQIDAMARGAPRQRYIMATEDRPYTEWGRRPGISDAYSGPGYLPGPADIPMIMQQAQRVLPMLSQNVGFPTSLMLNSFQGYQRASLAGQLLDMLIHRQNWKKNLEDSLERMEEEGMDMSSAFAAYGPDPQHPEQFNPQMFSQAMTQVAGKWNDGVLRDIVDNPAAVERLMQTRDKYYLNAGKTKDADELQIENLRVQQEQLKVQQEQQKAKAAQEEIAPWIEQPQQQQQPGGQPGPSAPGTVAAPQGGAGAAGGAPGTQPPTQTATGEGEQPSGATGGPETQTAPVVTGGPPAATPAPQGPRLTPAGEDAVQSYLEGSTNLQGIPKAAQDIIRARAAQQSGQLTDIANRASSGQLQAADVIPAVRAISPGLGDLVQNVINNQREVPSGGGFGAQTAGFWNRVIDLATKARPGWTPADYASMRKFKDADGYVQKTLTRANTMAQAAANILKDLNAIKDNKSVFARAIDAFNQNKVVGSPEYTNLFNDWQAFAQEDQALRSGTASVTETEAQVRTVFSPNIPGSKDQIRGAVIHNIETAAARIKAYENLWGQIGSRSNGQTDAMTGRDPEVNATIDAIRRMDPSTGNIPTPPDLPPMLQGAQPQGAASSADINKFLGQ